MTSSDQDVLALQQVLAACPFEPTALRTLADIYQLQGRYAEALAIADAAIAARPDAPEGWLVRGDTLANTNRPAEAAEAYGRAAPHERVRYDALVRLGRMQVRLEQPDAALAAFEAALAARPGGAEAVFERGRMKLERRDFASGWADYEARWGMAGFVARSRGQVAPQMVPALRLAPGVEDLRGRRVLLIGEQGIGDQVMFASMIPDLLAVAAGVVCVCDPRLVKLFATAFPGAAFMTPNEARIDFGDIDVVLAMGSLGSAFRVAPQAFTGAPYLRATPAGAARWAGWLGPRRKPLRLGLSWRGGVAATGRAGRSIALQDLGPVLDHPDCEFVSVQYGDVDAEVAAVNAGRREPVRHVPAADLHDFQDFADLLDGLDGLVSVQTTAVHLAGGLGKRCLAMIPVTPEWRYMRSGETLPWYGSVRLFRQAGAEGWSRVVEEVATAISAIPAR